MKRYIVDGHNLIPKIPGMRLSDPDDENKLLELLLEFCHLSRSACDLFFDQAPQGRSGNTSRGLVTLRMVPKNSSADAAIIRFLRTLKEKTRDHIVVSSDWQVQTNARQFNANTMSSEEFSRLIQITIETGQDSKEIREKQVSAEEVEEWLRVFSTGKNKNKN